VLDEQGAKMSKTKGNVVDPLTLIDEFGADALRFTLALAAGQNRDMRIGPTRVESGRNFATKLWNTARFCEMNGCATEPGFDPAGVAKRLGADGYGIVWAVVGSGIHGTHPHFVRYENLELPPPLHHRDFTVALATADDPLGPSAMDDMALADEALFDGKRYGTHVAGLIAGFSNVADKSVDWGIEESLAGIAPRCKLVSLKVIDDVDVNEPNDTLQTAKVTSLGAPGGTSSFTVRPKMNFAPFSSAIFASRWVKRCASPDSSDEV